ncbi:uncharacterized protein PV06_06029 [Exophiala oligosperma]|uniref:Small ribosomal subunit protein mS29 n=1 Tax=Exophiala oligosperma TaxID=215243 RepID=A0A0D2DHP0_9EURO|nr:uncharacterized protein PV06_06029 [Exophiala oligosperma]KIW42483.1 hypothetical protein PV06_06029 [Exophiala oligosperma]
MSLAICTDCLSRFRISTNTLSRSVKAASLLPQTASFHTSPIQNANVVKAKSAASKQHTLKFRGSQSARLKKKVRERPKVPPVGERRAQRRRIVLSNTNALEVGDMETWGKEKMTHPQLVGQVVALDGELLDQLRDAKAFKRTQNWSLFRRPATLIRNETIAIGKEIEALSSSQDQKMIKHLVAGETHSGKSILMLQTMCMAFMNDWLVLSVPEAQDLMNNTSSYGPLRQKEGAPPPDEQHFIQPHLAQALLERALYSNESVLSALKINHELPKNIQLKQGSTLKDLLKVGVDDHTKAWRAWQAFWRELTEPGVNPRPRVLLAADSVDHWMGPSKYFDAEHKVIHSQQFVLIRTFTDLIFGKQNPSFTNGGMVMFCSTGSNSPACPTFKLLISQMRAKARGIEATSPKFPLPVPFSKPDLRILDLIPGSDNVGLVDLNGLSIPESKGYLEYFAKSGLLQARLDDAKIAELRSFSAGGIVGELAKYGSRVRA